MIDLSFGENQINAQPAADVEKFFRQITKRYFEIGPVLHQAEQIGSRIKRRPYDEYISELKQNGIARVEAHGLGLYRDGQLVFHPRYQILFVKQDTNNSFEMLLAPKTH
jgi:hypothetical protein